MTARTEKDNERLQTIVLSCAKYEYFGGNRQPKANWNLARFPFCCSGGAQTSFINCVRNMTEGKESHFSC